MAKPAISERTYFILGLAILGIFAIGIFVASLSRSATGSLSADSAVLKDEAAPISGPSLPQP